MVTSTIACSFLWWLKHKRYLLSINQHAQCKDGSPVRACYQYTIKWCMHSLRTAARTVCMHVKWTGVIIYLETNQINQPINQPTHQPTNKSINQIISNQWYCCKRQNAYFHVMVNNITLGYHCKKARPSSLGSMFFQQMFCIQTLCKGFQINGFYVWFQLNVTLLL